MNLEHLWRAQLLLGSDIMARIAAARVILFGVGGVGSWCAEALVRTGIQQLTIVDPDVVDPSNINRQLPADTTTIGQPKVDVLRARLLTINPSAHITALQQQYCEATAPQFPFDQYDYVIDAIDALRDKAHLILTACHSSATLFSSMGAAQKLDPTRIRTAPFDRVVGDPLARALRQRFKRDGVRPRRRFRCVFSDECIPLAPLPDNAPTAAGQRRPVGSLVHITAPFGFTLASLVVNHIIQTAKSAGAESEHPK